MARQPARARGGDRAVARVDGARSARIDDLVLEGFALAPIDASLVGTLLPDSADEAPAERAQPSEATEASLPAPIIGAALAEPRRSEEPSRRAEPRAAKRRSTARSRGASATTTPVCAGSPAR